MWLAGVWMNPGFFGPLHDCRIHGARGVGGTGADTSPAPAPPPCDHHKSDNRSTIFAARKYPKNPGGHPLAALRVPIQSGIISFSDLRLWFGGGDSYSEIEFGTERQKHWKIDVFYGRYGMTVNPD
jgi:hypothetical protein